MCHLQLRNIFIVVYYFVDIEGRRGQEFTVIQMECINVEHVPIFNAFHIMIELIVRH